MSYTVYVLHIKQKYDNNNIQGTLCPYIILIPAAISFIGHKYMYIPKRNIFVVSTPIKVSIIYKTNHTEII